ncbi:MAG TPA: hypothetical protein VEW67_03630 [Thermoleophilaceae bacterium]|nr:hypothetical protein [Thermoleophilaceae bacterium]
MPSFLRLATRSLLIAACAAAALTAWTATAEAAVTVVIQPPGAANPKPISLDDVQPDIGTGAPQSFRIAKPGGGTQRVEVSDGVSLQKLLTETNTNFDFVTIQVPRPDGSPLILTKEQVKDPRNQQVFYTDPQGVSRFIGPRQANDIVLAKDYFEVSGTVTLLQRSQSKLKVTISPAKEKIDLGGSITFKASVTGYDPGESVTYTWGLAGRKQSLAGPRFTQKFPKKDDVYKFLVAVRVEGSETSVTDVATITVGDPEKADEEQTGGGEGDTGSDGGTTGGSGTGGSSTYTPSTYTPSYTPAPSTPTEPAPVPTLTPDPPPDTATSGTPVEGNLLADVSDPPPSNILESAAQAARQGKQKDDEASDGDVGVSEAAISVFAALALLGLGAGIESRQGRPPRLRLRLPRRAG